MGTVVDTISSCRLLALSSMQVTLELPSKRMAALFTNGARSTAFVCFSTYVLLTMSFCAPFDTNVMVCTFSPVSISSVVSSAGFSAENTGSRRPAANNAVRPVFTMGFIWGDLLGFGCWLVLSGFGYLVIVLDGTTPPGGSKSHAIGVFEVVERKHAPESVKKAGSFSMQ